jgi:hypothetical protein
MRRRDLGSCLAGLLLPLLLAATALAETQVIAGAGTSTVVVRLFFDGFAKQPPARGYEFAVPETSIKHAGGVKSAESNLFGRTGRPLGEEERSQGKEEILLAKVPIAFCVGTAAGVKTLSVKQLEAIFTGQAVNWKEFGGADGQIVTVGRERSESVLSELRNEMPFFEQARFRVVFDNDNKVIDFMKSPPGQYSITFGARSNLVAAGLNVLTLTGTAEPGVRLGLVYDRKNSSHPLVKAVIKYARSEEWRKQVLAAGLLPVAAP